ncbi:flippase-like domain-containing protein [Rhodobacteraceae bacterium]|nr:flippase-like domain-containing protein [Paracoccaceae bacterium]
MQKGEHLHHRRGVHYLLQGTCKKQNRDQKAPCQICDIVHLQFSFAKSALHPQRRASRPASSIIGTAPGALASAPDLTMKPRASRQKCDARSTRFVKTVQERANCSRHDALSRLQYTEDTLHKDDTQQFASRRPLGRPVMWLGSGALFLGLTVAGLWAVAKLFGGTLPHLDPRLLQPRALGLIVLFLVVYFLADGLRLHLVLRALKAPVRFAQILPLVFINILFSNITPLATGGGFAQVWYLQRRDVPVGLSAAATTIRTILAMLVIFVAAPAFQLLAPARQVAGISGTVIESIVVFIVLYLVGFVVLLLRPAWMLGMIEGLLRLLSRLHVLGAARREAISDALNRAAQEFAQGFRQFLAAPLMLSGAALLSTVMYLLTLFAMPALLMSLLGIETNWFSVIGTLCVVTFLMYFAPTPGGAGFSELAFAGLMSGQMAPDQMVLVIFAWRFLTIYLGMGIGAIVSVFALRPRAHVAAPVKVDR